MLVFVCSVLLFSVGPAWAQRPDVAKLRQEIELLKARLAEIEAALGIKSRIAPRTDFSLELDPVRPDDPFRRTYVRTAAHERLHIKVGLEKAPIGLEELMPTAQVPFVDRSDVSDRFAAAEELGVHLESRWPRWSGWRCRVSTWKRPLLY